MSTRKQIAAGQRRTLRSMRERLINMAVAWDGEDQYCLRILEELADKVEEACMQLVYEEEQE